MHIMPTKGISCMMSLLTAWSFWNMTPFDTKLKAFTMSSWKTTQSKWRFNVHLMPWIIVSHSPLVATPNWCEEKCVAKMLQNWRLIMWLVNSYNISHVTMGWTPLKGLVMAKRWAAPNICVIQCGMWPCAIWQLSWNNCGNLFMKSFGWNQYQRCSKFILEGSIVDKFDIHWNANLKDLNESLRSWSSS